VSLPVELRLVKFFRAVEAGEYSGQDATRTAEAIDAFSFPVAIAELVTYLVAGVAYIVWFRRARANLPRLGAVGLTWGNRLGGRRLVHPHRVVLHAEGDPQRHLAGERS
jgi:hypothetical protein